MATESKTTVPEATVPKPKTYRVLGIPIDWDQTRLEAFLADQFNDAALEVGSLAPAFHDEHQTATVDSLNGTTLRPNLTDTSTKSGSRRLVLQTDDDFLGLTTLYRPAPEDHEVDVVAVCGLGGHAYGSYRNKTDYHMWLRDSLPKYLTSEKAKRPMARVMTYGYKSPVSDSASMQSLGDLATTFRESLSGLESYKPLILIGHSLGGLILKQVIIVLKGSQKLEHQRLHQTIYGVVFFGVPHHGMGMEELIAMSELGPNLGLLTSLSRDSSMVLDMQKREFHPALGEKGEREVISFYETGLSPTAIKLDNGTWAISGPKKVLVAKASATHGRDWETGEEHICAINVSHSEIVKIGRHAPHKRIVLNALRDLSRRALEKPDRLQDPSVKFLVPYSLNDDFVGREDVLGDVRTKFELEKRPLERRCRTISLYGLGGIGKTQIAIAFAYEVRRLYKKISVLWVHASNTDRFRQAYKAIADELDIPRRDDPQANVLALVCEFLSHRDTGEWLMIIDNADDRDLFFPPKVDQVKDKGQASSVGLRQYIPKCNHGSVLVTTRDLKAGVDHMAGKTAIEVTMLPTDEAVQLIRRLGNAETTTDDAERLSHQLGGIPLALAQAVSFMNENKMSVKRYCRVLEESDSIFADQLSEDFQTEGRDEESLNAVAKTWMVSFDHIRDRDPLASKFLSIISLFDRNAIPEKLLIEYQRYLQEEVDASASEPTATVRSMPATPKSFRSRMASLFLKRKSKKSSADSDERLSSPEETTVAETGQSGPRRIKSIGTLIAFSLITEATDGSYDMHRLVQLVTCKWLAKENELNFYKRPALLVLSAACPRVDWDTLNEMTRLLPHLTKILADREIEKEAQAQFERGDILLRMGYYFNFKSQYDEAVSYAKQVHQVLQAAVGPEHERTLKASDLVLQIYASQGRCDDEVMWEGKRQLELAVSALGKEHSTTLRIATTFGVLHYLRQDMSVAQEIIKPVVEVRRRKWGSRDPDTLAALYQLALVYMDQSRLAEAEEACRELASTWRELRGDADAEYLASRHFLAHIHRRKGDLDLAIEISTEVHKKRKEVLGPEHADTLTSMADLALSHHERGNISQAYDLRVKVLHLQRKRLGENHPSTLTSMNNHAFVLKDLGRTREAIDEMRDCLDRKRAVLGAEHPDTLVSQETFNQWEEEEEDHANQ